MRKFLISAVIVSTIFVMLSAQQEPPPPEKEQPTAPTQPEKKIPEGSVATVGGEFLKYKDFINFIFRRGWAGEAVHSFAMQHIWLKEAEKLKVKIKKDKIETEVKKYLDAINSSPERKKNLNDYLDYVGVSLQQWTEMLRLQIKERLLKEEVTRRYRLTDEYMRKKFEEWYPKDKTTYWTQIIRLKKSEKLKELAREVKEIEERLKDETDAKKKAELELRGIKLKNKKGLLEKTDEKIWVEDVVRRLREGVPMAKIAQEEATGYTKTEFDKGYTTIERLYKPLRECVMKLSRGEVSDPIKDERYGYFVVKLVDKKEPGKLTFEDVKPHLTEYFKKASIMPKDMFELEENLRKKYNVRLYIGKYIRK